MNSTDIIVNEKWEVIKLFHIYVPELDGINNEADGLPWNRDYNFSDFDKYSFSIFENKWALTYNGYGITWNIFFGNIDKENNVLIFDGFYRGFPGHVEEEGGRKTDIQGYSIQELKNGTICLQALPQ